MVPETDQCCQRRCSEELLGEGSEGEEPRAGRPRANSPLRATRGGSTGARDGAQPNWEQQRAVAGDLGKWVLRSPNARIARIGILSSSATSSKSVGWVSERRGDPMNKRQIWAGTLGESSPTRRPRPKAASARDPVSDDTSILQLPPGDKADKAER